MALRANFDRTIQGDAFFVSLLATKTLLIAYKICLVQKQFPNSAGATSNRIWDLFGRVINPDVESLEYDTV